ncbi:accessory gene regulator B family protein [Clostridium sp. FP2]|uniref:accessory gene regulator B family protein n=1 Tax=Clostridium sp. FP2 TaxID=2724481 RepID=UPI0013E97A6A|nr:accessory gene regulator B family protein [Clostridium sp. FP2]
MDLSEKYSKNCTTFIKNNIKTADEELEKIQYGLHVFFLNISKLSILLVLAYFFNVITYTLVALISFSSLRAFASGMHASSSKSCTISTILIFTAIVYFSIHIHINSFYMPLIFSFSLLLVILYAPSDTSERPLISKNLRNKLKKASVFIVIMFFLITLLLTNHFYKNIITFSILIESILTTPLVYTIFGRSYKNYESFKF